jgi:hypothetical protein
MPRSLPKRNDFYLGKIRLDQSRVVSEFRAPTSSSLALTVASISSQSLRSILSVSLAASRPRSSSVAL